MGGGLILGGAGLTPELHPFFAGTYFPPGRFRGVLAKLAEVCVPPPAQLAMTWFFHGAPLCRWEDDPERCRAAGKQVIEQLREATEVRPLPLSSSSPSPLSSPSTHSH